MAHQLLPSSHTLPASLIDAAQHPNPPQWCLYFVAWHLCGFFRVQSSSLASCWTFWEPPLGGTESLGFSSPPADLIPSLCSRSLPFLQHFQPLSSPVLITAKTNSSWDLSFFLSVQFCTDLSQKTSNFLFMDKKINFQCHFYTNSRNLLHNH